MENRHQSDHDILITLVESVKNNQNTVIEKIDEVKQKVKEVNDGLGMKVADHEIRIRAIEKIVQLTTPEDSIKTLRELADWKQQFQITWRLMVVASATVGGIIGFILSLVSGVLGIVRH